jgi:dolichyl-phosphate-mannose-protein mannosyltransferase
VAEGVCARALGPKRHRTDIAFPSFSLYSAATRSPRRFPPRPLRFPSIARLPTPSLLRHGHPFAARPRGVRDRRQPARRRPAPQASPRRVRSAARRLAGGEEQGQGTVACARGQSNKDQKPKSLLETLDEWEFLIGPLLFTLLAFFTRNWRIGLSPIVTWDEAHFGKFGSHYLKREFYFDVHPPLGKMLVGLSGFLAGYNGSFEFKSGETYPPELNYTFMRVFNSTFGALCVPVAYFTAKELHFKKPVVWLVALMVLCENSYTTISRFILLDSMLLFFTFTTFLCLAKFHNERRDPFSPEWGFWLMMTGVSIGCVCSVKMVGLFCTALVGLYTIEDLWNKFGDVRMTKLELAQHLAFRVFCLIIVPVSIFAFTFWIHFLILENTGPGDAQMSSLFQANLRGTTVGKDSPLELAYGSRVTLKNMGYGGGLLHSHVQTYPEGSKQQQVTCYHHKDTNNDWFMYPNREAPAYNETAAPELVRNGDVIRILHSQTGRNLHSHAIGAPISKGDWEVSSYGNLSIGDSKDHWKVEVVDDAGSRDLSKVRTLTTAFRLRHVDLGCYLRAGNTNLPQWGFKQIEVTCAKGASVRDSYTQWNIESHWNDKRGFFLDERGIKTNVKSAAGRPQVVPLAVLARLHPPQRGHDDVQQRARAGPGQAGRPREQVLAVADPARGAAHVLVGRQDGQVLFAGQPARVLGLDGQPRGVRADGGVVRAAVAARVR